MKPLVFTSLELYSFDNSLKIKAIDNIETVIKCLCVHFRSDIKCVQLYGILSGKQVSESGEWILSKVRRKIMKYSCQQEES